MDFGIMFFGAAEGIESVNRYDVVLRAAELADRGGLRAVWTPERHFDEFGGLFPNPALTSAALAVRTSRLEIRAGSVVSPLHNTVRLAEDWSVVDNLSGGRVALSFGSGWNVNDFVLMPDRYNSRRTVMYEQIETVRRLWAGDAVTLLNPADKPVEVRLTPRPVRADLPIWLTASSSPDTFRRAGEIGANVLTHLIFHNLDELSGKIKIYREARRAAALEPGNGRVCLMLHTFLDGDRERARSVVEHPLKTYLRSAVKLEQLSASGGGTISGSKTMVAEELPADLMEQMLEMTFERYFDTGSLIGDTDHCAGIVDQVADAGVDEIACLIDFGVPADAMLTSLEQITRLAALRRV
ncbi:MupA/Atu3671 family FMN-dependent luciferase-like monooxygenase [Streptomyces sp. NPDC051218]|uniref:MupA/Atu3671 family FMN-dependent luciferase-like monooxygenase n=1 Tax=Streptomyces sp. NPDC051218 TaxID=3365645 RepID=UPI0037B4059E